MRLALSVYFFLAGASVEALSTTGDIWGGVNITQMVLQVAGAISSPTCNATGNCTELTKVEIPMCLKVLGNPGCWCSDDGPVHYCAICMSSPTDNTTTPDQTQAAGAAHQSYHVGCNAFQAYINGTNTTTSSSTTSSSSTSSSASSSSSSSALTIPTQAGAASGSKSVGAGTIGGIVVGGLIGLALIGAVVFLLYRCIQNKHERIVGSTERTSIFSAQQHEAKYPFSTGDTSAVTGYSPPPNPNIQRETAPYDTRLLGLGPQV